jgi:glyoxylase-like metal-dependent hydrolase (beta-lactamase superfamily II)
MIRPGEIAAARERRALREGVPAERVYPYRTAREEIEGVMAPVFPDRELREGDAVGAWRVLETPGHAPSHICLWREDDRVLIAGDLVTGAFAPYCDYGYSEDPVAELLGSLERLGELGDVAVTLPGHGRPIDDVAGTAQAWRDGLHKAIADVERVVGEKPDGAYGVMERVFGPDDGWVAGPWLLTQTMCFLRHLRLAGRVVRDEVRGRYVYAPAR